MKNKKHDRLVQDYKNQKAKELSRMANNLLKKDEKNQKLKTYPINNPFNFFDNDSTTDKG